MWEDGSCGIGLECRGTGVEKEFGVADETGLHRAWVDHGKVVDETGLGL